MTAVPATARGPRAARLGGQPRAVRWLKGTVGVLVAIGLWELIRALSLLPSGYVPSFPTIVEAVVDNLDNGLLSAMGETLQAWGYGMLITIALAKGDVRILTDDPFAVFGDEPFLAGWMSSGKWVDANRRTGEAFGAARL